jgi:hypothetical protein
MKEIMVCPNCGSPDINYASLERRSGAIIGIGIPEQYYCKNCGYTGSVILEIPKTALKHVNFKRFSRVKRRKRYVDEKSTEVLRPIYVGVLLVFLATALIFMFPTYEVFSSYEGQIDITKLASSSERVMVLPTTWGESQGTAQQPGLIYVAVKNSPLNDIDRALGTGGMVGFLTPLFFLLFLGGFLMLMIASHWHRIRMFT